VCSVCQKENENLTAKLSSDKDNVQLQKLQQQNAQLRDDCDNAKKVQSTLHITIIIISNSNINNNNIIIIIQFCYATRLLTHRHTDRQL